MNPPPQDNPPPDMAPPAPPVPSAPGAGAPAPLSEEEQMERFEAALKETDWGHQPC